MTEVADAQMPSAAGSTTRAISELEMAWEAGKAGTRLSAIRQGAYDFEHSMFYFPRVFSHEALESVRLPLLTRDWVGTQFLGIVLGEGHGIRRAGRPPSLPDSRQGERNEPLDEHAFLNDYLRATEDVVYGGRLDAILRDGSLSQAEKLARLVGTSLLGNPKNNQHIDASVFETKLERANAAGLPLQLVVPAFPFKDQNPFRVDSVAPDHVDAGDLALLVRLHAIALAIWQIYPYGAEWIILSDGVAYAPIFRVPAPSAERYRNCLREYRTRLNLMRTIHILDLRDASERLGKLAREGTRRRFTFDQVTAEVGELLRDVVRDDADVRAKFDVWVRGMKMNIELNSLKNHYGAGALWHAVMGDRRPRGGLQRDVFDEVARRAEQAAHMYAAHLIATRYTRLYDTLFPDAVRATVHPKQGQLALPRLGSCDPWNGIPILTPGEVSADSIRVDPLYVAVRHGRLRPRYILNGTAPFAYEASR